MNPTAADPARVVRKSTDAAPEFKVSFSDDALRITGPASGDTLVLFAVERTIHDDFSEAVTVWNERLTDDDLDGEYSLRLQKPFSPFTVMAIVDQDDGRYVVVTPGFIPQTIAAAGKLHGNDKGEPVDFRNDMANAEAILVSPGKGAWTTQVFDGTDNDDDATSDAHVRIAFPKMKPARGRSDTPAPDHLRPRDILIVINPTTLAVYADDVKGQ